MDDETTMIPDAFGSGFAADDAMQLIVNARVFASRGATREARQTLMRARKALASFEGAHQPHWCNAGMVALEISLRDGDAEGLEAEAIDFGRRAAGSAYWQNCAVDLITNLADERIAPAHREHVIALLQQVDGSPAAEPAGMAVPALPADDDEDLDQDPFERPASGDASAEVAPGARATEYPELGLGGGVPALPTEEELERIVAEPARGAAPDEESEPDRAGHPPSPEIGAEPDVSEPVPPPAGERPAAGTGAPWGGALWDRGAERSSPTPTQMPAREGKPAEEEPLGDVNLEDALLYPGEAGGDWQARLVELEDGATADLPIIFDPAPVEGGPIDARVHAPAESTDAEALLRSVVATTGWKADLSENEAESFYDSATGFLDMGQWEAAAKMFEQAMRNPSTRVAAAEGLIRSLLGMGNAHGAFTSAGVVISSLGEPTSDSMAGIYHLRAVAAEQLGEPNEAERCYVAALAADAYYAEAVEARERLRELRG